MRQGIIVFFCLCMRLMRIKIFTCASMRMDPHMRIIRMNRMDPQPHGHWPSLAPFTFTFTLESEEFEKFEKVACCCWVCNRP